MFEFPQNLTVNVTQDNIDKGVCANVNKCAVANGLLDAVKAISPKSARVTVEVGNADEVSVTVGDGKAFYRATAERKFNQYIDRFDGFRSADDGLPRVRVDVKPETFTLRLKAVWS